MCAYTIIWYGVDHRGFAIWPDLPRTQLLNHAVKTLPTVSLTTARQSARSTSRLYCFSTLDLQCGYWQMPVNPDDRAKTAFYREWAFLCSRGCHSDSQVHFQRLMDKLFCDLPWGQDSSVVERLSLSRRLTGWPHSQPRAC